MKKRCLLSGNYEKVPENDVWWKDYFISRMVRGSFQTEVEEEFWYSMNCIKKDNGMTGMVIRSVYIIYEETSNAIA